MKFSDKDIKGLAQLARIELDGEEIKLFKKQISGILEYVEKIQEVKSEDLKEAYSWDKFYSVARNDDAKGEDGETRKLILENVPEKQYGFVKVANSEPSAKRGKC